MNVNRKGINTKPHISLPNKALFMLDIVSFLVCRRYTSRVFTLSTLFSSRIFPILMCLLKSLMLDCRSSVDSVDLRSNYNAQHAICNDDRDEGVYDEVVDYIHIH